jgi:hypothetical protein
MPLSESMTKNYLFVLLKGLFVWIILRIHAPKCENVKMKNVYFVYANDDCV